MGTLAVESLGRLQTPLADVRRELTALPEPERWARLLPTLFRFQEDATVEAAVAGLAVADPALHARAAYALARYPRPAGAEPLRGLLADRDPWVRGWAARGLGSVGDVSDLARLQPLSMMAIPHRSSRRCALARSSSRRASGRRRRSGPRVCSPCSPIRASACA